jgi:hypothetical protein
MQGFLIVRNKKLRLELFGDLFQRNSKNWNNLPKENKKKSRFL